jgi:calcium permeable stress-gated cation channel
VTGGIIVAFCIIRPRNNAVYAPRIKVADEKHAPPLLGPGLFSWIQSIKKPDEEELVEKIGLDAVIFLRFVRMLRNIFLVLTVVGCAILIPITVVGGHEVYDHWSNIATLMKFTPQYIFGNKFWAFVICAYIFQATVCFFLWWNYRAVLRLRRAYFNSRDYRSSLHSRTLLLTQIPESFRSDAGIAELAEEAKPTGDTPRTAIARSVKDLPELVKAHDDTVQKLEKVLAKYLKDPTKIPDQRPTYKIPKTDQEGNGSSKVDAIDYLTQRMSNLDSEIQTLRESIEKRDPLSYGFASYYNIEDAHFVAFAARHQGRRDSQIRLAPKPHDLIWKNLSMTKEMRRSRQFWDSGWMVALTIAFIIPNVLTSVFLSDFSHLGLFWSGFESNLQAHPTGWGIAQGIIAPIVQNSMFAVIPILFRRLYTHSGDVSRTQRERHVTSRVFGFFVFNNLVVFSIFGATSRFVASVVAAKDQGTWTAIRHGQLFSKIMIGLCNISTFWLTSQMQKNLSAALDLINYWPLIWGPFSRRFLSPTPRQLIALSAPQPFDYAGQYNNFLFVACVGFCYGTLQPVILPVTAFYLALDAWLKKYELQYFFFTKVESGGVFWRLLVNRTLFSLILGNAVIALIVGAQGVGSIAPVHNGNMLYAMIPLPFLLGFFKWYCASAFDNKLSYSTTESMPDREISDPGNSKPRRGEKLNVRFGHPALYKRLLTPMVHSKAQHLLGELFNGRVNSAGDLAHITGGGTSLSYSDTYTIDMDKNKSNNPSKPAAPISLETIEEKDLDLQNFKKRPEFREEFGGDGELYGQPEDLISRPNTPSTLMSVDIGGPGNGIASDSRPQSPLTRITRKAIASQDFTADRTDNEDVGTLYAPGYHRTLGKSEERGTET